MPYQMLKFLATTSGPTVFEDPDDIERVLILRSAELVEADVPPTIGDENGCTRYAGAAVIHRVTAVGRKLANPSSTNALAYGEASATVRVFLISLIGVAQASEPLNRDGRA
jgi:hypothetical protein